MKFGTSLGLNEVSIFQHSQFLFLKNPTKIGALSKEPDQSADRVSADRVYRQALLIR
jgi:hypothetical protein